MTTTEAHNLDLFEGRTQHQLSQIDRISTQLSVAAGKLITRQGTRGKECFVIADGTVVVERDGEPVAEVGAGGIIGEIALIDGTHRERTATSRALTDCTVLIFSVQEFRDLVHEHPTVAARIERTAVTRLGVDHSWTGSPDHGWV